MNINYFFPFFLLIISKQKYFSQQKRSQGKIKNKKNWIVSYLIKFAIICGAWKKGGYPAPIPIIGGPLNLFGG